MRRHKHLYRRIGVTHESLTTGSTTTILLKCRCEKTKTEWIAGRWTLDQLNAEVV